MSVAKTARRQAQDRDRVLSSSYPFWELARDPLHARNPGEARTKGSADDDSN